MAHVQLQQHIGAVDHVCIFVAPQSENTTRFGVLCTVLKAEIALLS